MATYDKRTGKIITGVDELFQSIETFVTTPKRSRVMRRHLGGERTEISHVFPINRGAGRVELRVLGRNGDGAVSPSLLAEIIAAFQIEEGSQSTDVLTVLPAEIERITPSVTLFVPRGPDRSRVEAAAATGIAALGASLRRINAPVFREAIAAAAHVGPVVTVRVNDPAVDMPSRPEVVPIFAPPIVDSQVL